MASVDTRTTLAIPDTIAAWHREHVYFRRLLDLMHRQVYLFHSGERPNYELMLDIISYLREFSDRYHHPREDVAFSILARHCPDMKLKLAGLSQEHRVIANAGEALLLQLEAILNDAMVSRQELETAAATYLEYYRNHIAREEDEVLARAAEALTPKDWEAVISAVPAGKDPLFGTDPDTRFANLRRQVALQS